VPEETRPPVDDDTERRLDELLARLD
jgi:hypothetical protein